MYVDNMYSPALVVPVNLAATLRLKSGRAWVGFTAATGAKEWQVHDILQWRFTSTRKDPPYDPPIVTTSGATAFSCVAGGSCVHK